MSKISIEKVLNGYIITSESSTYVYTAFDKVIDHLAQETGEGVYDVPYFDQQLTAHIEAIINDHPDSIEITQPFNTNFHGPVDLIIKRNL